MKSNLLPLWTKPFVLCLANNLFLFIFYFAQTTILPIYILKELGGNLAQAGLAMTLFMISAIAVRPFSGLIIEKLDIRKTLIVSGIFFSLFSLAYLLADQLTTLFIIRFLHGIWFSILTTVCVPVVNQFIPEQRKGEGMGYYVMSVNLGIVLGPLIGLSLIEYWSYFQITTLLIALVFIGFAFCLMIPVKETENIIQTIPDKKGLVFSDVVEKKALPVAVLAALISFSYASIMSFIAPFAASKNLMAYASLFFVVFAISMMSLRPITGKIYDRKGPQYVIYPALLVFSLGLFLLSQIQTLWGFLLAAVLIGVGFGSAQPCIQTLAIQRAPKHRIGYATSTFYTFYDVGIAVGSLLIGALIATYSYQFAFILCSLLTLCSIVYFKLVVQVKTA
ncbi:MULTISPECIES: MFS transporter [unclassified Acinetobacter]|uniref:MFS transporter n=1 Tax=unclassified Acinetobacter TaxID=196816 RepID=UPI000CDC2BB9|nr:MULTISPECIES: MFS transporter [unclassified Acinetobacter]AUX89450.1 MFS transporter [Acinetobacter sp. ACNIH1]QKW83034.1 MFS transporter [Acinetobacter sp. FDAARGOS_724]